MTDLLKQIEDSPDKATGLQYYRQLDAEISLKCLSSGTKWLDITDTNPLYVIFMYGLWVSDDGDNDNDGYSNKVFDDGDLLHYGDTIIEDEFSKSSGFDAKLSAETIRVMSMWMAMATELYRAANSCRVGYAKKAPQDFNPVDHAAAFWYGTAQNPDLTDNASLYAWAKKAENLFIEQSMGTNDAIQTKLTTLQQKFNLCKSLPGAQQETEGIAMKHMADDITRWMTVPIVQYFIHHLATEVSANGLPKHVLVQILSLAHVTCFSVLYVYFLIVWNGSRIGRCKELHGALCTHIISVHFHLRQRHI